MDFFDHQEQARTATRRLVVLMGMAVVAIMGVLYGIFQGAMVKMEDPSAVDSLGQVSWWNPDLALLVGIGVPILITMGSLIRILGLRGGGGPLAESLGGRLVQPNTRRADERRLLNVVEEMAIASGTAVPPVYILDEEEGINAFAAGFAADSAVIGVTRGTVDNLKREQLQGVIAHEFSHILNGDMRLNIRLIGIVSGILTLHTLGRMLIRVATRTRRVRSRRNDPGMALVLVGFILWFVGLVGAFFARMIKASVSRQREFLADASAVQFTRNPIGLAGALSAIGGHGSGATVEHPAAEEASHMFFGEGVRSLFATHPPIEERIRRLHPAWSEGKFGLADIQISEEPELTKQDILSRPAATAMSAAASASWNRAKTSSAPAPRQPGARTHVQLSELAQAIAWLGRLAEEHVARARELMEQLPDELVEAAHTPYSATTVVYALMLDADDKIQSAQLDYLRASAASGIAEDTLRLAAITADLEPELRLPLVDLCIGALHHLTKRQYEAFKEHLRFLESADGRISIFEWLLGHVLERHLEHQHHGSRFRRTKHTKLRSLRDPCSILLSAQAHASHEDDGVASRAFEAASELLKGQVELQYMSREACSLPALDEALRTLDTAAPRLKRSVLTACAVAVAEDDLVSAAEIEVLRAVADALNCPMPPLVATTSTG